MLNRLFRGTNAVSIFCIPFLVGLFFISSVFADGLPGEYILTSRWRTLYSGYSPLTNPAFLTESNYLGARVALSSTLNEFYMCELGATYPIGLYQSAGVTWLSLGTRPYQGMENFQPTGTTINDNSNYFMFSYAINPWNRLTVGLNFNIAYQSIGGEAFTGVYSDLGVSYRLLRHQILGDHVIGLNMQNIVKFNLGNSTDIYPRRLIASWMSTYWEKRIEAGFDWSLKDFDVDKSQFLGNSADAIKLEWDLNGKLGTWLLRIFNLYGLFGINQTGFDYWGIALGVNIPSINFGRDASLAFQYISMTEGNASSYTLYLRSDFGLHREEWYARKMAHLANISPNMLYIKALTLYSEGNYWDAYFVFGRINVEFPDFFKNDWVSYYLASCQEHLDMRNASVDGYTKTKQNFGKSSAVPFTDLGLMRVYFRNNDFRGVSTQFNLLNQPDVPDSLKYHAYYIMGQASFQQKDYLKAKQALEMIPGTHPEYLFAQHTLAIINYIGGQVPTALNYLENCVQWAPKTKVQSEIINRSLVMMGYLFYENAAEFEGALANGVTALRKVPKSSYYYEDALLGMGWLAIKARQWQDCFDAGEALSKTSSRVVLQAEGALLKAYSNMMQKNFAAAVPILEEASNKIENYKPTAADSLATAKQTYTDTRKDYEGIAQRADQLASTRQSSHVLGQIDSLTSRQKPVKKSIDEYLVFSDNIYRTQFFSRNAATVKEDIQYALARAQKMSGAKTTNENKQKLQEKGKEIDQQIEKLKQEMKKLDTTKENK